MPTRWREVAARRAKNEGATMSSAVAGFGDGALRDMTTSMRAVFRRLGVSPCVVVKATQAEDRGDGVSSWVYVALDGMQKSTILAEQVVQRSQSNAHGDNYVEVHGTRKRVTTSSEPFTQTFHHGTDLRSWLQIMRDRRVKSRKRDQPGDVEGVYSCQGEAAKCTASGYDEGFVVELKVTAAQASHQAMKNLTHPCPGLAFKMKRAAIDEFCFHQDSVEVIGFRAPREFLSKIVKEVLFGNFDEGRRLAFTPDDAPMVMNASSLTLPMTLPATGGLPLIEPPRDNQVEAVLDCLLEPACIFLDS